MKKFTLAVLVSVTGIQFCAAGLPDQDPAVAKIRTQFTGARTPTVDDIRDSRVWHCRYFDARENMFDVSEEFTLNFYKWNGEIILSANWGKDAHNPNPTPVVFEDVGLVVTTVLKPWASKVVYRIDAEGNLIGESNAKPMTEEASKYHDSPSISYPETDYHAGAYYICPLDRASE